MSRSRLRWLEYVALAVCLVPACVVSDRQVEESEGGGGSTHGVGGSSAHAGHGSIPKGGTSNLGKPENGGMASGGMASGGMASGGRFTGAGMAPIGGMLQLGGAPADCVSEQAGESAWGGAADHGGCFEPLAQGLRCEGAEAHAQGPKLERVCGATSLSECQAACLERPDCTGVSDYLADPGYDGCALLHDACGTPGMGDWQEEDAGKEYVKVCPAGEACHFEYLGNWIRCEGGSDFHVGATSLRDCVDDCLQDPMCNGVTDYFYLRQVRGCYLYTGTCNTPKPLPYGDNGKAYVRRACGPE